MKLNQLVWAWAAALGLLEVVQAQENTTQEPTTPEVVVEPEPTTPPVDVFPTNDIPFTDPSPTNITIRNYPSLREQRFEGLDGLFRSDKSLFDVPGLGTIVSRDALDERQPKDMFEALQTEVGVLMQRTAAGQSSPFIRGLTGQQVLILMDGIRVNNSIFRTGPNQYFNLIDPGMVDHIEVMRGPQSVLYGSDAIGGAINVVSRSARSNQGDYGGGGFTEYVGTADKSSYSRASLEGWVGDSGVYGGAMYTNVRDLYTAGALGTQPFTNYSQYSGDVKYNRLLAEDHLFTLALQHFEQEDVPRSDRFLPFVNGPPANGPRPTFFDPQQRDLVYARLQGRDLGGLVDAYMITGSYQRLKEGDIQTRVPPDANAGRVEDSMFSAQTGGFSMVFVTDLDWFGKFSYGADYYYDDIDASRTRYVNGVFNSIRNPQYPDDAIYDRTGAFINWDVAVTEDWNMVAGVRYENIDTSGTIGVFQGPLMPFDRNYNDWIASLGLIYHWREDTNLIFNFSEGFRAPNLDDLAADATVLQVGQDSPSLNVESEHSYNYEFGIKVDRPQWRSQAFVFWNDFTSTIQRQPVGGGNFIRANFNGYIYGTEITNEWLLDDEWSLYGNFWYTFGEDRDNNEPISRIPPMQAIYGLRWRDLDHLAWFDLWAWSVNNQDRYAAQNMGDARFILGNTPGYTTINMRLGLRINESHLVSLNLENLTNKAYRVLGSGTDAPGINAVFGYQWNR